MIGESEELFEAASRNDKASGIAAKPVNHKHVHSPLYRNRVTQVLSLLTRSTLNAAANK